MANRPAPAPALVLREGDKARLEGWLRSQSVSAGRAKRARMILLASEGVGNREISARVGASPTTVIQWRSRYEERGLRGLEDLERTGRPRELDHRQIVAETLKPPPKERVNFSV